MIRRISSKSTCHLFLVTLFFFLFLEMISPEFIGALYQMSEDPTYGLTSEDVDALIRNENIEWRHLQWVLERISQVLRRREERKAWIISQDLIPNAEEEEKLFREEQEEILGVLTERGRNLLHYY